MTMSLLIGYVTRWTSQGGFNTADWHCVRVMWWIRRVRVHQMWTTGVPGTSCNYINHIGFHNNLLFQSCKNNCILSRHL